MTESASLKPSPPARSHTELAVLLAQMGAVVLSNETVGTTVELVTTLAMEAIPGTGGAGLTLVDDRVTRSMAASNSMVEQADALQYRLGAGPCLTAWRDQVTVQVDDVLDEQRWPQWCEAAATVGVRSVLSVPLVAASARLGAIKVYSNQPAAFDEQAGRLLELFARQAAILLANTQTLADARQINLQLTDALANRDVIGQAKGILLAQGAVDDTAAFALLVAASQRTNTKLHTVARQLVESVTSRNADGPSR
jgi:GAF domain-containing protein